MGCCIVKFTLLVTAKVEANPSSSSARFRPPSSPVCDEVEGPVKDQRRLEPFDDVLDVSRVAVVQSPYTTPRILHIYNST